MIQELLFNILNWAWQHWYISMPIIIIIVVWFVFYYIPRKYNW
jgi:hypothetical protein